MKEIGMHTTKGYRRSVPIGVPPQIERDTRVTSMNNAIKQEVKTHIPLDKLNATRKAIILEPQLLFFCWPTPHSAGE